GRARRCLGRGRAQVNSAVEREPRNTRKTRKKEKTAHGAQAVGLARTLLVFFRVFRVFRGCPVQGLTRFSTMTAKPGLSLLLKLVGRFLLAGPFLPTVK